MNRRIGLRRGIGKEACRSCRLEFIHIVLAADEKYRPGLEATKTSIVRSCRCPERLKFHEFRETPELAARIRREFGQYKGSPMAFLRLYLAELLPDVDQLIYSDVDTLWGRDVAELADVKIGDAVIGWVKDLPGTAVEFREWCRKKGLSLKGWMDRLYSCTGVCVIDLKKWRERKVLERCQEFVAKHGVPKYADQDILNYVLKDEAVQLPRCWDVLIPSPVNTHGGCVLHLTGVGRCFQCKYEGKVLQYRYWEHVARGCKFLHPNWWWVYVPRWVLRCVMFCATTAFVDRVYRFLSYRWYFSQKTVKGVQ